MPRGGARMTDLRVIAVIADEADLVTAWRERAEELNASRSEIDRVAGLPTGYAGKMMCIPPIKYAGPQSFWNVCGALGLAVQLVVDPTATARFAGSMDQRDTKNARLRRMIHKSKLPWLITPETARKLGAKGGSNSLSKRSLGYRKKIARMGVKARDQRAKARKVPS